MYPMCQLDEVLNEEVKYLVVIHLSPRMISGVEDRVIGLVKDCFNNWKWSMNAKGSACDLESISCDCDRVIIISNGLLDNNVLILEKSLKTYLTSKLVSEEDAVNPDDIDVAVLRLRKDNVKNGC